MENRELVALNILTDKLSDELVARLSELSESKQGRLNFHFAADKLGRLKPEATRFSRFVQRNHFKKKRDRDISHKTAPQTWDKTEYLKTPYPVILRALAKALRLMKKIDRIVLGPSAPFLWRKARERRYKPIAPPKAGYMILPHLFLSPRERQEIILQEMDEGRAEWEPMKTRINGSEVTVPVYRKWAAIILDQRLLVLDQYPLNELESIDLVPPTTPPIEVPRDPQVLQDQ